MPSVTPKTPAIEDLRQVVYAEVITSLGPASLEQKDAFMANLRLPPESLTKFLLLRVSPGMGETPVRTENPRDLLRRLDGLFGRDVDRIAGFYRDRQGNLCWTLPGGCAIYGYRSHIGFFNGLLCQPLGSIDKFWLLSSARFGGAKAIRLSDRDAALFEAGIYRPVPRRVRRNPDQRRTNCL
jgi:hypothetical protein